MKHLKRYNESLEEIEKIFNSVISTGRSQSINTNLKDFKDFKEKFNLYDNYYYYRDNIFKIIERASGDWFSEDLELVGKSPIDFKEYLCDRIEELTIAFNKIDL